jgi:hypothetical protein
MLFWALLAAGQITMRKFAGGKPSPRSSLTSRLTSLPEPISSSDWRLRQTNSNTNCDGAEAAGDCEAETPIYPWLLAYGLDASSRVSGETS